MKLSLHELPAHEKPVIAIPIIRGDWKTGDRKLNGFQTDVRIITLDWDYNAQKWALTMRDKLHNITSWDYPMKFDDYAEAIERTRELYTAMRAQLDDDNDHGAWTRYTGPQPTLPEHLRR